MVRTLLPIVACLLLTADQIRLRYIPTPASGMPTVAWSTITTSGSAPNSLGQTHVQYDATSQQVLAYLSLQSGFYSTEMFALNSNTGLITRLGGTPGGDAAGCGSFPGSATPPGQNDGTDSDVLPWPGDRHPDFQSTLVGTLLVQWSGLVCGNPGSGEGTRWNDLWFYTLHADPTTNTWLQHAFGTEPFVSYGGGMAYNTAHAVIVLHGPTSGGGNPETWLFCYTATSLSGAQIAAGCDTANDWEKVFDPITNIPPRSYQNNLFDDPVTGKVLMFGTYCESCGTWTGPNVSAYDVEAKTWTDLAATGAPSNQESTQTEVTVVRATSGTWSGKFFYHRTCHQAVGSGCEGDYLYDSLSDTYTALSATGAGPQHWTFLTFDPTVGSQGALVGYEYTTGGNPPTWWKGVLQ